MGMATTRTYESFDIRWADGATWTNWDSADEAQGIIDRSTREGTVVRRTFTVQVRPDMAHLYRKGI
jgi:hypothetical protein